MAVYGDKLDAAGRHLDVKGAGWVAAFPTPDVTVSLSETRRRADQFDEKFEADADSEPSGIDFLGNGIDAGFRVGTRASADRVVLSIELAWLLALADGRGLLKGVKFNYHDRHQLKGVLRDKPYPLFSLDAEREFSRQKMREIEDKLRGSPNKYPNDVEVFLSHFMKHEKIEFPRLLIGANEYSATVPESYIQFQSAWADDARSLQIVQESEAAGEMPQNIGGDDIPESVVSRLSETILNLTEKPRQA